MTGESIRGRFAGVALALGAVALGGWSASAAGAAGAGAWTVSAGPESITVSWSGYSSGAVATPFTTPGAVSIRVTSGDGSIAVAWSPPASDGGSRVLQYVAQATGPSGVRSCSGSATGCSITGLANGTQYSVSAA